jgi:hypothetical protein
MKLWKVWAKAMGSKISDNDRESDAAAIVRTIFLDCEFDHLLFYYSKYNKTLVTI